MSSNEEPPIILSIEQRTVLEMAATGAVTSEIALILGVSEDEVRVHLRGAFLALGARSKLEALIIALRHGLIEPPA